MLRIFLAFVKKESFHILRDTRTLVILFGMPIALVLIFGYTVTNEFKDASIFYTAVEQINTKDLINWLKKSKEIQWDYKNIVKRKGQLERLK